MTALLAPQGVIDQIGAALVNVGTYRYGADGLGEVEAMDAAAYVAVPTTIEWVSANALGTNPKTIATVRIGIDLHVWGRTEADVWVMLACWIRASREQFGGLSRVLMGSGRYLPNGVGARGWGLVQAFAYEMRVENPTIPASPTTTPGTSTATDALTEVSANHLVFSASGSASGDNKIHVGET